MMKKNLINILSGTIAMSIVGLTLVGALMAPPQLDPKQVECLAKNIYFEARSERVEGQIAVAHVTINRAVHSYWPNAICEVVYEHKQFSWTHLLSDHTPHEKQAYEKAMVIARDVMIGNVADPTYGSVFYHANYVNPNWVEYMTLSKVIGNHLFYTWDGNWNLND